MGRHAAAIRISDLDVPTAVEVEDMALWRAAAERSRERAGSPPHVFVRDEMGDRILRGPEHAAHSEGGTLCGIPGDVIVLVRHHFYPDSAVACQHCVDVDPEGPGG